MMRILTEMTPMRDGVRPEGDGPFSAVLVRCPYQNRERFVANLLNDPYADPPPGEPRIRYFLLGANEWRSAGSRKLVWRLANRGAANTRFVAGVLTPDIPKGEFTDSFVSAPNDPIPSIGGRGLAHAGTHDRNEVETRSDILVCTSPELAEDLDAIGKVRVELYAESTAVDTDFTAKRVDVFPDGRAFNIAEGVIRAAYRDGGERRTPDRLPFGGLPLTSHPHCVIIIRSQSRC